METATDTRTGRPAQDGASHPARDGVSHPDRFANRHIGPSPAEEREMLDALGYDSLDALSRAAVPDAIQLGRALDLPDPLGEQELLADLRALSEANEATRSYIGMGYHGTFTPPVIQRNVLENPGWYTQYTPYQAEIAQGRLEALLNFQTVVSDLTGLPIANASLLDEGTAAAEAMSLFAGAHRGKRSTFLVDARCHPQTVAVVKMRAEPVGIDVVVGDWGGAEVTDDTIGALVQYPTTDGEVVDYAAFADRLHDAGAYLAVAADLLALTLLEAPGAWGADAAVGNSQRFGVPMGYGGPHAAFFATTDQFARKIPGRIIGVSQDRHGEPALRMALQTREQHIRREKATSNICTAQVLLANMAGFYAVYHGPDGLKAIAEFVHGQTQRLAEALRAAGHEVVHSDYFDTLRVRPSGLSGADVVAIALEEHAVNLRLYDDGTVGVALDETVTDADLEDLVDAFGGSVLPAPPDADESGGGGAAYGGVMARETPFLEHPTFHAYRSETEMLRYLKKLENRDLSLVHSMIPLGSCTMKLNATAEMMPITFPGFANVHPFAPDAQTEGYEEVVDTLEEWLAEITGFDAVSLMPNSGAQGEYTGLLTIRAYHRSRGDDQRTVCLIPTSAHGTNPASAVMAGMDVVAVKVDDAGEVDMDDLRAKAEKHADRLAALMITYPSTHGVFETTIREMADVVHDAGGLVYMDGANLNAMVGLCRPGDFGMDVCHLNLHKTFAIPHGGGGPGMGPIGVVEKLEPFLPRHPVVPTGGEEGIGPVASAPYGSALVLLISWAYIAMMGADGLRRASQVAILNANYMAKRLEGHYDVLYRGPNGLSAHEFILDVRPFQKAGVSAEDIAKRLIDYGFHAPTMSWPVTGTLMVEPTESESKAELDRFCDAMIAIRTEIQEIELGTADADDNVLKMAPHTVVETTATEWTHPYSREQAAWPAPWSRDAKFWPTTGRVDNAFGDRNLVCSCPPMEAYA
ncbi:aminomethyl-transferring glycine dehydrogenase [Rubrivirga sp. S365]|uniref:Glycine dehydrogenase (decarboxylating) n=1 Tax=Rubrivirga litoralis TaxID=3075598 RepID=A0ABU3BLL1_9BACT|nr:MULTISPECIES: aminomethyl-transferring glycine dehydrogenase [unclassified Rubrivirga]MDT0630148.1 aminomethyl-transferring glycine dehydrogenase [Rubrivirga sp. F394]MDT7855659.1 aminomethyl-transferring glycine dehydrogenase [Rubrivirga sp. S365]